MARFDVLTLFPQMFEAFLGESIIGRARAKNIIQLNFINIRDFSQDKHRRVDDYPYGGGPGMVMQVMPIYNACKHITDSVGYKPRTIYMSPRGAVFNQSMAKLMADDMQKSPQHGGHIILLCGHYEGVDQRVIDEIIDEEISVGDFVLTGGEIPAMCVIDAVCRLIPGVLKQAQSFEGESHYNGLLEYPQYTRPAVVLDRAVPDVLLSGHHAEIEKWKLEQSLSYTKNKRPDMIKS